MTSTQETGAHGRTWTYVTPEHSPDKHYEGWDGTGNYRTPFPVGTRLRMTKLSGAVRVGMVTRTEGYAPDVHELDAEGSGTDLVGWTIEVLPSVSHRGGGSPSDSEHRDADDFPAHTAPRGGVRFDPPGTCHLVDCKGKGQHPPHPGPMSAPTSEFYARQGGGQGPGWAPERDGRCRFIYPPEAIRCVRMAPRGQDTCGNEDHDLPAQQQRPGDPLADLGRTSIGDLLRMLAGSPPPSMQDERFVRRTLADARTRARTILGVVP